MHRAHDSTYSSMPHYDDIRADQTTLNKLQSAWTCHIEQFLITYGYEMNSLSILAGCFNLGFSGKILNFRPLEAVVLGGVGLVIICPC